VPVDRFNLTKRQEVEVCVGFVDWHQLVI
jgi:hypothetical protein